MASCDAGLEARYARLAAQVSRGGIAPFGGPAGAQWLDPSLSGCPDDCVGDHLYGFDSGVVAAGATALIVTEPQLRNQPRRLFLTEAVATNFLIRDIRVGVMPLLATTGPISAACFTPAALVPNFKRLICEVNQQVTVEVQNITAADQRFLATMSAYIVG